MKYPITGLAVLLLCTGIALGVDTAAIDALRAKTALSDADAAVIDQFVAAVVREMLVRTEFTSVAQARDTFVLRMIPTSPNPKYEELFVSACEEHFREGLAEADKVADLDKRNSIKTNLLIMLDKVGHIRTAKVALGQLSAQNVPVRYWALRCLMNPAVVTQLNEAGQGNPESAREIASQLKGVVATESSPYCLELALDFADGANAPEAADLLITIANRRIGEYENWTVRYEFLDGKLLDALCKKAKSDKAAATAFGQLFSHCMQKYIKYMESPSQSPILGEQQAGYLASVLVAIEKGCLSELRGSSSAIQNAIAKGGAQGASALTGEYALLFGTNESPGELSRALGATYVDAAGKEQATPRPLPGKPAVASK